MIISKERKLLKERHEIIREIDTRKTRLEQISYELKKVREINRLEQTKLG